MASVHILLSEARLLHQMFLHKRDNEADLVEDIGFFFCYILPNIVNLRRNG